MAATALRPDMPSTMLSVRSWRTATPESNRPIVALYDSDHGGCGPGLSGSAMQAAMGPDVRDRGRFVRSPLDVTAMPTVHPSSILRAQDETGRDRAYRDFLADLRGAARW